jgi:hypothetical protein
MLKKIWANFQRIIELFTQKFFTKPGSGSATLQKTQEKNLLLRYLQVSGIITSPPKPLTWATPWPPARLDQALWPLSPPTFLASGQIQPDPPPSLCSLVCGTIVPWDLCPLGIVKSKGRVGEYAQTPYAEKRNSSAPCSLSNLSVSSHFPTSPVSPPSPLPHRLSCCFPLNFTRLQWF